MPWYFMLFQKKEESCIFSVLYVYLLVRLRWMWPSFGVRKLDWMRYLAVDKYDDIFGQLDGDCQCERWTGECLVMSTCTKFAITNNVIITVILWTIRCLVTFVNIYWNQPSFAQCTVVNYYVMKINTVLLISIHSCIFAR